MKKIAFILMFFTEAFYCHGQAVSMSDAKKKLLGTWLCQGDSVGELQITSDSITTFRFKLNGVTRCTYTLSTEPCVKQVKFPAATGIYIAEKYKDQTKCCALAELTPTSLKIIYPDGYQAKYLNESALLKGK